MSAVDPPPTERLRRWRFGLVMLLAGALLLYLLVPIVGRIPAVRGRLERALAAAIGSEPSEFHIGALRIGYNLAVHLDTLSAATPGQPPFLQVDRAVVGVSLLGLSGGQPFVLQLTGPHLFVDRVPASGGDSGPFAFPFRSVKIEDGYVHILQDKKEVALGPVSVAVNVVDAGQEIRLSAPRLVATAGFEGQATEATLIGRIDRDGQGLRGRGTIVMAKAQLHDGAHQRAIENLALRGTLDGRWTPSGPTTLSFNIMAPRGEVLWDRFYADMSQHPMTLHGELQQTQQTIRLSALEVRAEGIGSVTATAEIHPATGVERLDARVEIPELSELYALAVRDPYQDSHPFLVKTSVKGRLSARGEYRRLRPGTSVTGELRLTDVTMSMTRPAIEVRGLSIDLPIQLGANHAGRSPQRGRVHFTDMHIGNVEIPETTAILAVDQNALALAEPLAVPLLDGMLLVGDFAATDLVTPQRQVSVSMTLRDLDLAALAKAMEWPRLSGAISGAIPRMTVQNGQVRSDGEIRVQVFGGTVSVTRLRVDQILSSVPTVGLDLDFEDISLGRLTDTLEVGRISGVARGAVHDLAIVSGQPVRFDAWMETVPTPDVKQRISVTAIGQLSIMSGSGTDPLSQGLLSFFDEYRYAKMGFRCRLENDTFLLHGVETVEGKEYLVVGSFLPPRVNVISHNQEISFSEMVRRLRRVTAEPAPVKKEGDKE